MMRVVRVRTKETIAAPLVKALIMCAVEETVYPGTTPQSFYDELAEGIKDDKLGVFVGFADSAAVAVAVAWLPWSQAAMAPQVILMFSKSRKATRAIGVRLREWIKRAGFDRLIGINLFHDDELFCRTVRHVGTPEVIGSLIEVRI